MARFAKILGLLGLGSDKEAVTEAHLEAADTKIAQLEQAKLDAEGKLATAQTALQTAQDEKTKVAGELATAQGQVSTLEEWKKNQKAVDGREEDDSNSLDEKPEAQEPWEKAAASAIADTKKRLGVK